MTTTEFTKQERDLLIAALDNQQERYEITAHWLFSRIQGYYDDVYQPKIRLFESIRQKILLLDADDERHHPSSWTSRTVKPFSLYVGDYGKRLSNAIWYILFLILSVYRLVIDPSEILNCSSQVGGGGVTTTQQSSSSMTGTTRDGDGDGILDSNDNCPNLPHTRC